MAQFLLKSGKLNSLMHQQSGLYTFLRVVEFFGAKHEDGKFVSRLDIEDCVNGLMSSVIEARVMAYWSTLRDEGKVESKLQLIKNHYSVLWVYNVRDDFTVSLNLPYDHESTKGTLMIEYNTGQDPIEKNKFPARKFQALLERLPTLMSRSLDKKKWFIFLRGRGMTGSFHGNLPAAKLAEVSAKFLT